jgi:hypothetical protein
MQELHEWFLAWEVDRSFTLANEPAPPTELEQKVSDLISWAMSDMIRSNVAAQFWLDLPADFGGECFERTRIFPDGTTLEQAIERIKAEAEEYEQARKNFETQRRAMRMEFIRQVLVNSTAKLGLLPPIEQARAEDELSALGREVEGMDFNDDQIRHVFAQAVSGLIEPYDIGQQRRSLICSVFCSCWPAGYASSLDRLLEVAEARVGDLGRDPSEDDLCAAAKVAIEDVKAEEQHRHRVLGILSSCDSYLLPIDLKAAVHNALMDAPVGSSEEEADSVAGTTSLSGR